MNKFTKLIFFAVFLMISGLVYEGYYRPAEVAPVAASGRVLTVNIRALENQWKWEPNVIKVRAGDRLILKVFNEDGYDHGFALEALGINKRLFPKRETVIDIIVPKVGKFNFYCSVPCGQGHYQQVGHLIVEE